MIKRYIKNKIILVIIIYWRKDQKNIQDYKIIEIKIIFENKNSD